MSTTNRLNVVPTVTVLAVIKNRLSGAQRGYRLLKKKADALTMRYRSILKKIVDAKAKMGSCMKHSAFALTEAKYVAGEEWRQPALPQGPVVDGVRLFFGSKSNTGERAVGLERDADLCARVALSSRRVACTSAAGYLGVTKESNPRRANKPYKVTGPQPEQKYLGNFETAVEGAVAYAKFMAVQPTASLPKAPEPEVQGLVLAALE